MQSPESLMVRAMLEQKKGYRTIRAVIDYRATTPKFRAMSARAPVDPSIHIERINIGGLVAEKCGASFPAIAETVP
ncbi:MAG: hypothetical protein C7B45_14715 [Sulfobacillus acidophilus]|uniref:Uncharacterized protein n=1 Tax=Sulfobacillus acidophilus TaxID=53633 RepID=A0A2T2WE21_9FIRM|nr:MAG: hypothetical protein C7B45_14715 [Sulfobacillus acidophilus]